MIIIERYTPDMQQAWDEFAAVSRQASFLFERSYMDYHSHRFTDFSLVARDADTGRIVAMLPANATDGTIYSHQGLTYGGWLTPTQGFTAITMLEVMTAALAFLRENGINTLYYKSVPWFYCTCPAEDDLYALFRFGAVTDACGVSSVIDLTAPLKFGESSHRNRNRAIRFGLTVHHSEPGEISEPLRHFWPILEQVLQSHHGVCPVHTLDEMLLLASRFPDNIRLVWVEDTEGAMIAGTVVYLTRNVLHTQYMASSDRGRKLCALALMIDTMVRENRWGKHYLDFGISTEHGGRILNEGLHMQKSGFGARSAVYPMFRLTF